MRYSSKSQSRPWNPETDFWQKLSSLPKTSDVCPFEVATGHILSAVGCCLIHTINTPRSVHTSTSTSILATVSHIRDQVVSQ